MSSIFGFVVGLNCEGIYRISGVKSKVQALKDAYNKGVHVYLHEYEPNIVASLLKQYLRDLPEPVLTSELMPKFEQASSEYNPSHSHCNCFAGLFYLRNICHRNKSAIMSLMLTAFVGE